LNDPTDTQGLGAVVLAAGAAGVPGAVAERGPGNGPPPARDAARAAVEAGFWPVVVVVGRDAEAARSVLAGLPVATVLDDVPNPDASTGIRRGLARMRECAPGLRGALILDCARPTDAPHLVALAAALRAGGRPIAASAIEGALGLPALFAAEFLPELIALAAGEGAAAVLARDAARVTPVPPSAAT
jgi:molybdenum cofactor cytidylyltransferase